MRWNGQGPQPRWCMRDVCHLSSSPPFSLLSDLMCHLSHCFLRPAFCFEYSFILALPPPLFFFSSSYRLVASSLFLPVPSFRTPRASTSVLVTMLLSSVVVGGVLLDFCILYILPSHPKGSVAVDCACTLKRDGKNPTIFYRRYA